MDDDGSDFPVHPDLHPLEDPDDRLHCGAVSAKPPVVETPLPRPWREKSCLHIVWDTKYRHLLPIKDSMGILLMG